MAAAVCVAVFAAGCSSSPSGPHAAGPTGSPQSAPPPVDPPVDAPLDLAGPRDAQCPYLEGGWVETTTGQRVTGTSLDTRFIPPACFFWSYEAEAPQLTVLARTFPTHEQAVAAVDAAAPIDSTQKALDPAGWSGGRCGGPGGGSVYAVWKGSTAVIVTAAQEQSVKAQQVAEQTIRALAL
ncbi:DUF2020 domain-containing protein [Corynebacterium heidelbergense]|uniref:DUF2020 domain-containing protein n=1 Tax=Corynebacterium heidelbergense TaxID=2055947 RepID=A0A364VCT4_9CORY|nr:DUF2020 domain-containing protein [Corynebacterium heidelbergense]RAV34441.1 DUF2020 domain-containing protein [Corynebacterium heidelbergense]